MKNNTSHFQGKAISLSLVSVLLSSSAFASGTIIVNTDADLAQYARSGDGSMAHPYIIGPLTINSVKTGAAVSISNVSHTSFQLYNLTISGNPAATTTGIAFNNVNGNGNNISVVGAATSIQSLGIGITINNSSYITLDGMGENPNGPGINGKSFGTINKNALGAINVENSNHITIKGWQMSANGGDYTPNYLSFDPGISNWGVGGVRFFKVTNSLIDHNAANNDTDVSYSLFASSHNVLSYNTGDYPYTMNFLVADGSTYNTIQYNDCGTADFIGMIIVDPLPTDPQGAITLATYGASHDNVIANNNVRINGPTGNEIHAALPPSFIGGIMIVNGTYNNKILNNTTHGSFGSDLGWAQMIPDPTTPIGVATYPPAVHCNVGVSEGGGGITNQNGNVWSGNTYKTIDPCIIQQ